jgi:hypothetical protein
VSHYEDEQYPDYEEYLDTLIWPSIGPGGHVKTSYLDTMAPQHCASAIHKLRRWNASQWARDIDVERHWVQIQRRPLYRGLAAKATGMDDLSVAIEPEGQSINDHGAGHLLAKMMFEGADDSDDAMVIAKLATRAAANLYKKGYVILLETR